jgi:retron-type reverse transcriptase
VTDRLIQQALLQVLQPILDPVFSEHSYGFWSRRCAPDAVLAAQTHVQTGRRVVVDVDLEEFFTGSITTFSLIAFRSASGIRSNLSDP